MNLLSTCQKMFIFFSFTSYHKFEFFAVLVENDELLKTNVTNRSPSSSIFLPHCTSFTYDWVTENIFFIQNHVSINVQSIQDNATKTVELLRTSDIRYMWTLAVDPVAGLVLINFFLIVSRDGNFSYIGTV